MFYIAMTLLMTSFVLTVIREKKCQNEPSMQQKLRIITYILISIAILIVIFG